MTFSHSTVLKVADQYHEYEYGDQSLLNRYFIGQWKELEWIIIFMVWYG